MKLRLPIGYEDFGTIMEKGFHFVDKSLFIKDFIDHDTVQVAVITRPRRFGKTLNLSMLHHFLADHVDGRKTEGLFEGLKIAKEEGGKYLEHQGKYPVIFMSFKDVKDDNFQDTLKNIQLMIQELYRTHRYLLDSDKLKQDEKELFKKILVGEIDKTILRRSLGILCELLYRHTNKKVFLLIDEYDTPIQSGYSQNYYNEIINFMRGMLGAALKTNPYLSRAVITGILRVSKESLFSGLNNVDVFSLLNDQYSEHFGFTEEEVAGLLKEANMLDKEKEIKRWYNGYIIGNSIVYNPWSIVNCINKEGVLKPYWVNTSDNVIIKKLITKSSSEFKEQFELLLQDKTIKTIIDENVVFGDLQHDSQAAWSLLVMAGYLKVVFSTLIEGITECELAIPNLEVKLLYRTIIKKWLGNGHGMGWYQSFLIYLLEGNVEKFTENFGQVLAQTISIHDIAHNPEAFYHGFMLGLTAGLDRKQYELKSNRESGKGRYDIAIIPKDISKPAIILEIKSIAPQKMSERKLSKVLDEEAQKALEQINSKQYISELEQRGLTNIVKIGLAFSGKEFSITSE